MKIFYLFFVSALLVAVNTYAQKRKTFKINPGEKLADVIPKEEKYSYANFTTGNVYLRNETFSRAPLNYNALFGEMQFIDPKGDTLSIADENNIKQIVINNDTFYYSKGYLKQIQDYGEVKLAAMQFFSFVNRQKIGGFGEVTSASIDTYNAVSGTSYFKELVAKELLTVAKSTVYFIGDKFNNFKVLNKRNLLEAYARKEKEVQAYLKENKVDFSDEEQVKKILFHLSSFSTQ
jgi:hypothetical protein